MPAAAVEVIIDDRGGEECLVVHRRDNGDVHQTARYDYYPQAFRRAGALNPYVMVIHAREPPDPRDWSVHDGEEVVLILSGCIDLHQEDAEPVRLGAGLAALLLATPANAAEDEITVGGALSLTGIQAPLDTPGFEGAQVAVKALNDAGALISSPSVIHFAV